MMVERGSIQRVLYYGGLYGPSHRLSLSIQYAERSESAAASCRVEMEAVKLFPRTQSEAMHWVRIPRCA